MWPMGLLFRSGDCFDAPSHTPYAFVVRVENKIHIVNIACCMVTMIFMRVMESKFLKIDP